VKYKDDLVLLAEEEYFNYLCSQIITDVRHVELNSGLPWQK
jgi:hypothetical protein